MKRKFSALAWAALWILCVALTSQGQKVWEKPYQTWTLSEALQILVNSPWGQSNYERIQVGSRPVSTYTVIVSLRSALPVRQALLRKKQLEMNYDKFTSADKARFDNETKEFLECPDCAKYYMLTIRSPVAPGSQLPNAEYERAFDVIGKLKDLSLQDLKPYLTLRNDSGASRELVGFIPPKGEGGDALFVFARFDDHRQPLLTTSNKKFFLKIDEKLFDGRSAPMKSITFNVARLTFNGEVVF